MNIYEILDEIEQAYPEDIFPDTTQGVRDDVAERYPGFIDRTSAMMGRHLAKVIRRKLADGAGEEDRLYKTARALLDYFDERGPKEFATRFGSLDVLDVCRQIVQEGEGEPHPWPGS
jgi:hypothetical protein